MLVPKRGFASHAFASGFLGEEMFHWILIYSFGLRLVVLCN